MTNKKEIFIETVEALFNLVKYDEGRTIDIFIPTEAAEYFEEFKTAPAKKAITDKGVAIIMEMREVNDWISAKSLGERMDISGRSVSGTMRKLVTDGYVEKREGTPASYKITEKGLNCEFENVIEES